MWPGLRTNDRAVSQRKWARLGKLEHPIARTAQRRIQAQDHGVAAELARWGWLEYRGCAASLAGNAILHFFELVRCDAHRPEFGNRDQVSKGEKAKPPLKGLTAPSGHGKTGN